MNDMKIRTYDIMIFVVLAAIAFSLNDVYLAVEFSLVLILASSPAFLAAARCAKHASATGERKINKSIKFAFLLYFRLISYVFFACLLANVAWSLASEYFPIEKFFDLRDTGYAIDLNHRIFKSVMIFTDLIISWIMIRRFSGISHGGAVAQGR